MRQRFLRLPYKIGVFFLAVICFAVTLASALGILILVNEDAYQTSEEKLTKDFTERYLSAQVSSVMRDYVSGRSPKDQPEMNYYYRITDASTGEVLVSTYHGEDYSCRVLASRSIRFLPDEEAAGQDDADPDEFFEPVFTGEEADGESILSGAASPDDSFWKNRECTVELWAKKEVKVKDRLYLYTHLLSFGYAMRYYALAIAFFFGLLTLFCLMVLYWAAGRSPRWEGAACNFFDRIPFDLYFLFFGLIGLGEVLVLNALSIWNWFLLYRAVLIFGLLVADFMLFCAFSLSFATRVKTKTLWKNTLLFRLLRLLSRLIRRFLYHLPFIWKSLVLLFALNLFLVLAGALTLDGEAFAVMLVLTLLLDAWAVYALAQAHKLSRAAQRIASGDTAPLDTSRMIGSFRKHGDDLNAIGEGIERAVAEKLKSERFKTELITNVSHDIKTPLTSIVNYVDLLQKEDLHNEKASEYLEVLARQSARLKKLVVDLVEASKASSGAVKVEFQPCRLDILLQQALGEYEEKWEKAGVQPVLLLPPEEVEVLADPRLLGRVIDNLLNNVAKYAQSGTRAYLSLETGERKARVILKNISSAPLNLTGEELMERFVRGDSSRNTEGSGLGLSIAKTLTELQKGTLELSVDGDLFKVTLSFPLSKKESEDDI